MACSYALLEGQQVDSQALERWWVTLLLDAYPGYHRIELQKGGETLDACQLVVRPARCYQAPGERSWGVSMRVYALRSERNWGIGDFADLGEAAAFFGARGADFIGINPLHALLSEQPEMASPYSPSSRVWLNPLYLAPDRMTDFTNAPRRQKMLSASSVQARLEALRNACLVDYAGVAALKREAFALAYDYFRDTYLADEGRHEARRFAAFRPKGAPRCAASHYSTRLRG